MHWCDRPRIERGESLHDAVGVLRVRHVIRKRASLVINQSLSCAVNNILLGQWLDLAILMKQI